MSFLNGTWSYPQRDFSTLIGLIFLTVVLEIAIMGFYLNTEDKPNKYIIISIVFISNIVTGLIGWVIT